MERLPAEISQLIFGRLPLREIVASAHTCVAWRRFIITSDFLSAYYRTWLPYEWKAHMSLLAIQPPSEITLWWSIFSYHQCSRYLHRIVKPTMTLINTAGKRIREPAVHGEDHDMARDLSRIGIEALQRIFANTHAYYRPDLSLSLMRQYRIYVSPSSGANRPTLVPSNRTVLELAALFHDEDALSALLAPGTRYVTPMGYIADKHPCCNEPHGDFIEEPLMCYVMNPKEDVEGFRRLIGVLGWSSFYRESMCWDDAWKYYHHPFEQLVHHSNRTLVYPIYVAIARGHTGYVRILWDEDVRAASQGECPGWPFSRCTETELSGLATASAGCEWPCPSYLTTIAIEQAQPAMLQFLLQEIGLPLDCPRKAIKNHCGLKAALRTLHPYRTPNIHRHVAAGSKPAPEIEADIIRVIGILLRVAPKDPVLLWKAVFSAAKLQLHDIVDMIFAKMPAPPRSCCEARAMDIASRIMKKALWVPDVLKLRKTMVKYGWGVPLCAKCMPRIAPHGSQRQGRIADKSIEALFEDRYDDVHAVVEPHPI